MDLINDIIEWLGKFWDVLYNFFYWIASAVLVLLKWMLIGLLTVLITIFGEIFFFIADGFFTIVEGFFSTLDLSSLALITFGSDLNEQLVWFAVQLGLAQCISLLASALTIRLLLNLIPASLTRI
ncbi:MAG: hypothetical protein ACTFAL_10615 [Candidatus Electronema sp. V4]|uniref:hypothetical protein n=1 Tax=Candidatus Electronema sp. V4 TaxID=3454756 RepID=UPI00405573F5